MFEELIQRDALRIALSGRDEASLETVLIFLTKYLNHPDFSSLLVDVIGVLFGACPVTNYSDQHVLLTAVAGIIVCMRRHLHAYYRAIAQH